MCSLGPRAGSKSQCPLWCSQPQFGILCHTRRQAPWNLLKGNLLFCHLSMPRRVVNSSLSMLSLVNSCTEHTRDMRVFLHGACSETTHFLPISSGSWSEGPMLSLLEQDVATLQIGCQCAPHPFRKYNFLLSFVSPLLSLSSTRCHDSP